MIETTDDCPARLQQIKREITQQITHAKEQMSHLKQQVTQRVINFAFSTHEVCLLVLHYILASMVILGK